MGGTRYRVCFCGLFILDFYMTTKSMSKREEKLMNSNDRDWMLDSIKEGAVLFEYHCLQCGATSMQEKPLLSGLDHTEYCNYCNIEMNLDEIWNNLDQTWRKI